MIKTNRIIPLFLNKRIHITNYSSFLSKYIVQTEQKAEHKTLSTEHTSPIRNTPEKVSYVLNNRTLREINHLLEP